MNEFDNIFVMCIYGNDILYLYLKCISFFVNVLLNNYRKLKSNKINEIKIQKIVNLNKITYIIYFTLTNHLLLIY